MPDSTVPKFKVGEKIKLPDVVFGYEIVETPATCIYNGQPAYLLKSIRPIHTPPFYREQNDVESNFFSFDGNHYLFDIGTTLRHEQSGGLYIVEQTPDKARLEATGEPAYFYRSLKDGLIWARNQRDMEDGRFKPVLLGDSASV